MADQTDGVAKGTVQISRLRDALHKARIEAADRSGVVVDLRDAELARLEILNEALDSLFEEIPAQVDLFDRGISRGDTPRLWIDSVAHVAMGRDKRIYRLVQDTRFGRTLIAESHDVPVMVDAITDYIARRMIEREQALIAPQPVTVFTPEPVPASAPMSSAPTPAAALPLVKKSGRVPWTFVLGFVAGIVALFAIALIASMR
ncbi:MAG: hypothetical protein EKK40_01380 [Bradyrhizobiaceae bacterium]|nr:MAG: hypothetical protein EKK40_01380 [Bradyrhizobiaceae bacterium]